MTGPVHAKAIASTTDFRRITSARETAVRRCGLCAAIEDIIATVAFLIIFEASIDEIFSVTKRDAVFHGHVHGVGITAPCESAAADIISAYER